MKLATIITKNTLAKVLGGFAVGALLLATTVLPQGTIYADGPSNPSVNEQGETNTEDDTLGTLASGLNVGFSESPVTLGEEFYHPVTGELNVGFSEELVTWGEEFYHPVTGELNVGFSEELVTWGEEFYHPVTGEINVGPVGTSYFG